VCVCICMCVCVFVCMRACGPRVINGIRRKEKRKKDSKLLAAIAVLLLQPRFKVAYLSEGATRLTALKEFTTEYSHTRTCSTSDIESRNPLNLYSTHLLSITWELLESRRGSRIETKRKREHERDQEIARETYFLSFFLSLLSGAKSTQA